MKIDKVIYAGKMDTNITHIGQVVRVTFAMMFSDQQKAEEHFNLLKGIKPALHWEKNGNSK
jgi:hypothetical protein